MTAAHEPPSDISLIRQHVAVLFTHDTAGRLLRVNEPDGGPAPWMFLGRTRMGHILRIRHDLPSALAEAATALIADQPPPDDLTVEPPYLADIQSLLADLAPVPTDHHGPAYSFPARLPSDRGTERITQENAHLLGACFPTLIPELVARHPCYAAIADDVAVSVCYSARRSAAAAEAGVETHPAYRGRGLAVAVTSAWARAIRHEGLIPLYSTSWDNLASQTVARKLGLHMYGVGYHLT